MKNVIAWMKLNPVSVASLFVIVLSLGFIGWVMLLAGPALRETAAAEPSKILSDAKRYTSQSITVPPANADDLPETRSGITINEATISVLKTIFEDLESEATGILQLALQINQANHQVLVPDLFPDTPSEKRFTAKLAYVDAIQAMVGNRARAAAVAEKAGLNMPYLNAGMPLEKSQVQAVLDQKQAEFLQGQDISQITEDARKNQTQNQRTELRNMVLEHAQTINIYAQPNLGSPFSPNANFPLQIASLATIPDSPTPSQLWEGQLELWILQDLVQAIALANRVGETHEVTNKEGETEEVPYSVIDAPVKRLLLAEVLPGYVGLHNMGGLASKSAATGGKPSFGGGGGSNASKGAAGYSPPAGGLTKPPRQVKLSDNFLFGPTGRSSNGIFDVRHARLIVHADFQRLPELFNAISRVNLMTVLDTQIRAVDEFGEKTLGELYVYGGGDMVEVEMIIESIWMREWTTPLMPPDVQEYLGLKAPTTDSNTPGNQMDPFGFGPGNFNQFGP